MVGRLILDLCEFWFGDHEIGREDFANSAESLELLVRSDKGFEGLVELRESYRTAMSISGLNQDELNKQAMVSRRLNTPIS